MFTDEGMLMKIARDRYLTELLLRRQNGMIKVVTGMRRSGKSYLLLKLFHERLVEDGISEDHILEIALDDLRNIALRTPEAMLSWITGKINDKRQYYLILDEVQFLTDFPDVLNSCLHIDNLDVYVTGSNSRFLSTDVLTEFRGRGDEIHLFPLSFAEYSSACELPERKALDDYLRYGGLPYILSCKTESQKTKYLENLCREVYLKDVVEHNHIRHSAELEELLLFYASSIGSLTSLRKLADTFRSVKGISISINTIASYTGALEDAFLIDKALRYDIKGRRYIDFPAKYYFEDMGLRNSCLNFRQVERNHLMENVIYNELRCRGFSVDVGAINAYEKNSDGRQIRKNLEVDFVANQGHRRYYIQSAYQIPDDEKREQESRPLRRIRDAFRKIIVTYDDISPYHNDEGVLIIGLAEFLKNEEAMDL